MLGQIMSHYNAEFGLKQHLFLCAKLAYNMYIFISHLLDQPTTNFFIL